MKRLLIAVVATAALAALGAPAANAANTEAAIKRGETYLHTDTFGMYGCEDFVDAAFGLTTETGIAHDAAFSFFKSLEAKGLAHYKLPAPRGALVFSKGTDGNHVDISLGNGKYLSGGVQGLKPGWGDGSNIQIIPAPNLGPFELYGWTYAPWR